MKLMKIAALCMVAIGGVSLSLAAASYAQGPDDSIFAKEVAVLTRQGVPPAHAERALKVQGQVARANLVNEVRVALGEGYAGAWYEPAAARIHFGVTSEAGGQAVQQLAAQTGLADVVTLTPVRFTWAALIVAQDEWDRRLGALSEGEGNRTGLDAELNAVVVTVSSSLAPEERAALEREAADASVNVFVRVSSPAQIEVGPAATCKFKKTLEAYCEKTLVSGVGIAPEVPNPNAARGRR